MLRWLGVFVDKEIPKVSAKLLQQLANKVDGFPTVLWPPPSKTKTPRYQVRAILFDLYPNHKLDPRCISGETIMNYIWECLRPDHNREECAVRYDFGAWGVLYEPIVRYFKDRRRKQPGCLNDLVKWISEKYAFEKK